MPKIGVVSAAGERERERESVSNLNLAWDYYCPYCSYCCLGHYEYQDFMGVGAGAEFRTPFLYGTRVDDYTVVQWPCNSWSCPSHNNSHTHPYWLGMNCSKKSSFLMFAFGNIPGNPAWYDDDYVVQFTLPQWHKWSRYEENSWFFVDIAANVHGWPWTEFHGLLPIPIVFRCFKESFVARCLEVRQIDRANRLILLARNQKQKVPSRARKCFERASD